MTTHLHFYIHWAYLNTVLLTKIFHTKEKILVYEKIEKSSIMSYRI